MRTANTFSTATMGGNSQHSAALQQLQLASSVSFESFSSILQEILILKKVYGVLSNLLVVLIPGINY